MYLQKNTRKQCLTLSVLNLDTVMCNVPSFWIFCHKSSFFSYRAHVFSEDERSRIHLIVVEKSTKIICYKMYIRSSKVRYNAVMTVSDAASFSYFFFWLNFVFIFRTENISSIFENRREILKIYSAHLWPDPALIITRTVHKIN